MQSSFVNSSPLNTNYIIDFLRLRSRFFKETVRFARSHRKKQSEHFFVTELRPFLLSDNFCLLTIIECWEKILKQSSNSTNYFPLSERSNFVRVSFLCVVIQYCWMEANFSVKVWSCNYIVFLFLQFIFWPFLYKFSSWAAMLWNNLWLKFNLYDYCSLTKFWKTSIG